MNVIQDSNINAMNDTVFIPLYLQKNSLQTDSFSVNNISATEYITTILQDSFPLPKKTNSIFVEKTPMVHKNLVLTNRENNESNLWIFGVFLLIGIIFAILMRFARENIFDFLSGCFSKNQVSISTKDGERVHSLVLVPIIFIFLPIFSLLMYNLLNYFNYSSLFSQYNLNQYTLLLAIYLGSFLIYFTKIIIIKFFGWMFKSKKVSNYYIQIQYNFDFLMGISLFLPVFCLEFIDIYYKEIFIFISLFILGILFVTRLARNFYVIIKSLKFSHFYLFFYLCALELLPLILLGKFLFF